MGDDVGGLHQKFVAVVVPEIRVGQVLVGLSSLVPTKNSQLLSVKANAMRIKLG